jgi:hypothetical protein
MLRNVVAANQSQVARVEATLTRNRHSLSEAQAHLQALTRPRRFRRLDHHAIDETQHRIQAQQRYLARLEDEHARLTGQLERSQRRLRDVERAVARIPEVETAIARRGDWILGHPAELAWEADLATRLAGPHEPETTASGHDHAEFDHALEELLQSIDLRTIDLSPRRPRTGIERTASDALGLSWRRDADIAHPPLPGHGLDAGPDLGP